MPNDRAGWPTLARTDVSGPPLRERRPTVSTWFDLADSSDARFTVAGRGRVIASTWRIAERPRGRVSLETPAGSLVLGVITRCWDMGDRARSYQFDPEPGDVVSLTRRCSRVPWPRSLGFSVLGGPDEWWAGTSTTA